MSKIPCKGKNAKGEACGAAAGPGGLCYFHANPDLAKELGRLGGQKNGHSTGTDIEVPAKMTLDDLNEITSKAIRAVFHGEIKVGQAEAVAKLIVVQRQNLTSVDFEKRIAELERQAATVLPRPEPVSQQGREVSAEGSRDGGAVAVSTGPVTGAEAQAEEPSNSSEPEGQQLAASLSNPFRVLSTTSFEEPLRRSRTYLRAVLLISSGREKVRGGALRVRAHGRAVAEASNHPLAITLWR
jgi:hypothetical protein